MCLPIVRSSTIWRHPPSLSCLFFVYAPTRGDPELRPTVWGKTSSMRDRHGNENAHAPHPDPSVRDMGTMFPLPQRPLRSTAQSVACCCCWQKKNFLSKAKEGKHGQIAPYHTYPWKLETKEAGKWKSESFVGIYRGSVCALRWDVECRYCFFPHQFFF